jgi:hypothetical protein
MWFAQEFVKGFKERFIGQAVDRTVIDSAAGAHAEEEAELSVTHELREATSINPV